MTIACETGVLFECFNREGLAGLLPHRGAALRAIDGVFFDHGDPGRVFGYKQVTSFEPDLDGHFPSRPTYPGYAQDEFACLTAAALILHAFRDEVGPPRVVQKTVRYRKQVSPGDLLTAAIRLESRKSRFFLLSGEIRNQLDEIVARYEKIVGAL